MIPLIELKLSYNQLKALNAGLLFLSIMKPKKDIDKCMVSTIYKISIKLEKKELTLKHSYTIKKTYSIKLEFFEAYFLEMFFRSINNLMPFGYDRSVVENISNQLNQKLA